ncbi:Leucine-rich repeat extensin-like protein 7 [Castilleja foliolosa]|uniref:Cell wall hydroxyproline-rich glycoprotein n=1 Tax=Castilleja foliolosa TaxID=1961234 RepID=A0ABD3ERB0_9LAMI
MIHHLSSSKTMFPCILLLLFNFSPLNRAAADNNVSQYRHLLSYNDDPLATEPWLEFENSRLKNAYIALQSWKESILSDPTNITANWVGPDPCNYTGVFCWPAPDNNCERTVAGIDINHADIAGHLPHELGLLFDLAIFHINSNRFCGPLPESLTNLKLLHELDLSNNHFAGPFPKLLLQFRNLKYLDIRYNEFEGEIPSGLFDKHFDAIFVNDNRFSSALPENIGNSPVSVVVMANNKFGGCLPASLGNMGPTLHELVLTNNGLSSCFPWEIGRLTNLTVLDVSRNKMVGPLPESIGNMGSLEQLNLGGNMMSGEISTKICRLPNLRNFDYGDNYFTDEDTVCLKLPEFDDTMNCFRGRPNQKPEMQCRRFLSKGVNCSSFGCAAASTYSPPPPPETGGTPATRVEPPVCTAPLCPCLKPPPMP